jgi:hypothetical protein
MRNLKRFRNTTKFTFLPSPSASKQQNQFKNFFKLKQQFFPLNSSLRHDKFDFT